MKTSIARRFFVPALLALGLAACGADDDTSGAGDEPVTTSAPASTGMADMNSDDADHMDMNRGDANA